MGKGTIMSSIKAVFGALWNVISGKIITVGFLRKHFAKIAIVLFVIFGFIANRFSGMLEMRRIDRNIYCRVPTISRKSGKRP